MTKFSKITLAITLLLFMEQSFATVMMSCDVSNNHSSNSHSSNSGSFGNDHVTSGVEHLDHKDNLAIASGMSFESPSDLPNCESEKHSCHCEFGACSVLFLPVDGYHDEYSQSHRLSPLHKSFSSFQLSSLYRPPIFA